MPKSSTLALNLPALAGSSHDLSRSPTSTLSPVSPPLPSPTYEQDAYRGNVPAAYAGHPSLTSLPPPPPRSPKHRSIFSMHKGSKASSQSLANGQSIRQISESNHSKVYPSGRSPGSTPDLTNLIPESASIVSGTSSHMEDLEIQTSRLSLKSGSAPHIATTTAHSKRNANKPRFGLLSRSRSIRADEGPRIKLKPSTPVRATSNEGGGRGDYTGDVGGLRTAPLREERSFRDMMKPSNRNRSADRNGTSESEHDSLAVPHRKDSIAPSSYDKGSGFLSNIKSSSTKAADGIGKAGKGIFGKLTRSGSSHEREVPIMEDDYVCKVINLPLVEQTRRTRISKRLEHSKDKTEFWMPALPWRCIDYLNMKANEQEGLYRVPGSGREIKYWQMRFDTELDIDLFNQPNLYDINIVASMFKAWLRELPDEIFPKSIQAKIAEECQGATQTPQMLKDELSKLPPFNYYLLFATTCHISLLHSCAEENKMNFQNLVICFQPSLNIDPFCFQWLILDWRNCWQGCWTEKEYLDKEMEYFKEAEQKPPPPSGNTLAPKRSIDERALSSSGSSRPSLTRSSTPEKPRPQPAQAGQLRSNGVPELSPMKPLSPIGPI